jgi:hypothetical protein
MTPGTRTKAWWAVVGVVAATGLACNGLLGITQLTDDGGVGGVDSGSEGDGDAAEDAGPSCSGVESVSSGSTNPACEECLKGSCCKQLQACAGDTACVAERSCSGACGDDGGCRAACRNDNACGLNDDFSLDNCTDTNCLTPCTGLDASTPSDAGNGGDAGDAGDAGACVPVNGPCSPYAPQCGCSAGQSCVFSSVGGTTECIAPGDAGVAQACAQDSDCAVGLSCVYGACKQFCDVNAQCASTGSACFPGVRNVPACGTTEPVLGDAYCTTPCDPVNPQATCGAAVTCVIYPATPPYTDCVGPTGAGVGPGGCSATTYCAPGYYCIEYTLTLGSATQLEPTCEHFCRVGFTADCAANEACIPFSPAVQLNGATYGSCTANCALDDLTSCPAGSGCAYITPPGVSPFTDCLPSSGTGVGAGACATDHAWNECAPGYECVDLTNGGYSCLQWCRMSIDDCPDGKTCTSFSGAPTIGGVAYGACE